MEKAHWRCCICFSSPAPLAAGVGHAARHQGAGALEAENAQLRAVAGALTTQRDAFESLARQLQAHAVGVEGAFTALQAEARELWSHVSGLEDAARRAKRTQTAYEAGLAQLLMLLGKQQAKIRKCVGRKRMGRRPSPRAPTTALRCASHT